MLGEFEAFMDSAGIVWQHTGPNTPQQNGVAERVNLTMEERITDMLDEAGPACHSASRSWCGWCSHGPSKRVLTHTPVE